LSGGISALLGNNEQQYFERAMPANERAEFLLLHAINRMAPPVVTYTMRDWMYWHFDVKRQPGDKENAVMFQDAMMRTLGLNNVPLSVERLQQRRYAQITSTYNATLRDIRSSHERFQRGVISEEAFNQRLDERVDQFISLLDRKFPKKQ
jgi:hypothetical protein